MLLPTSVDLLRCIEHTLATVIAPRLTGTEERSAAATIGHLLRHVVLRIQHEGTILLEDLEALHRLLTQVKGFLELNCANYEHAVSLRTEIATHLGRAAQSSGYRDVPSLAAEVHAMRELVSNVLTFLQGRVDEPAGPTAEIYDALKRYAAWQVEQEARLIDPAFEGFGPRR